MTEWQRSLRRGLVTVGVAEGIWACKKMTQDGSSDDTNACLIRLLIRKSRRYLSDDSTRAGGPHTEGTVPRSSRHVHRVVHQGDGRIPSNNPVHVWYPNGVESSVGEIWLVAIHIDSNLR